VPLLAPTIRGHPPRLVDRKPGRDQQRHQRGSGISHELNSNRAEIGARQGRCRGDTGESINRLGVEQQQQRREYGDQEFRDHPVVAEQAPPRPQ
jgi:hypothetical protein